MIEKIGHIKNPLTVIAMFAGIAEVSGTVVLPFISDEAQGRYVWFLMLFPCLLVTLFFYVLWHRHEVLYAPSDYKEDKGFWRSFDMRSIGRKAIKIPVDAKQDPTDEDGSEIQGTEVGMDLAGPKQPSPQQVEHEADEAFQVDPKKAVTVEYARSVLKSQSLNRLGSELGGAFYTDVAMIKHKDKMFDFVSETSDATCIGTVFYALKKLDTVDSYHVKRALDDVQIFWEGLNADSAGKFVYAAVVISENLTPARRHALKSRLQDVAKQYPFHTMVKVWDVSDLSGQPIS